MKSDKDIFSRILAIVSILIALFALFQTYSHDRLSLKPKLDFMTISDDSEPQAGVSVENEGLGPATIQSMDIFVDRVRVENWQQASDYCKIKNPTEVNWREIEKDDSIKEGKSIDLFYRMTKNKVGLDSFLDCVDKHLAVSVTYCSFDDECWTKCSNKGHCN